MGLYESGRQAGLTITQLARNVGASLVETVTDPLFRLDVDRLQDDVAWEEPVNRSKEAVKASGKDAELAAWATGQAVVAVGRLETRLQERPEDPARAGIDEVAVRVGQGALRVLAELPDDHPASRCPTSWQRPMPVPLPLRL